MVKRPQVSRSVSSLNYNSNPILYIFKMCGKGKINKPELKTRLSFFPPLSPLNVFLPYNHSSIHAYYYSINIYFLAIWLPKNNQELQESLILLLASSLLAYFLPLLYLQTATPAQTPRDSCMLHQHLIHKTVDKQAGHCNIFYLSSWNGIRQK